MSRPAASRAFLRAARPRGRAARTAVRSTILLVFAIALLSGVASAHAQLVAIDPPDGSVPAVPPARVTLTFNEPVGLATGGLRVLDASGTAVDLGEDEVDGASVRQALPALPDGWYVVTWGIISEDGHVVRASSTFGVGDADAAARPDPVTADASTLEGVARFVGDLGLLVAAGAWLALGLLQARARRVRVLALGATAVALAGTVAWGSLAWTDGGDAWIGTPAATLTVVRGVLLAVALVPAGISLVVPGGSVLLSLVTLAGGGHAAGDPWSTALLSVHLVAAVVWLGAAPAVLLTLRDRSVPDAQATVTVRRFSRTAAFALVAVGAAGAALAWNLSDGLAAGYEARWTVVLAAKVTLVVLAAIIGAWGRRHLGRGPDPDRRRLITLFSLDAALLVAVAALSAGLTLSSPHVGHAGHPTDPGGTARCVTTVGDRAVSLILAPGRVGTNEVLVGGVGADVEGVALDFRHGFTDGGALSMTAEPAADGWRAAGPLPLAGGWEVTIAVREDRFTLEQGTCQVRIEP